MSSLHMIFKAAYSLKVIMTNWTFELKFRRFIAIADTVTITMIAVAANTINASGACIW